MNEYAKRIKIDEFQHSLATFGNAALIQFADELAEQQCTLQLDYDLAECGLIRGLAEVESKTKHLWADSGENL
jgi:hypothetical protein